MKLNWLVCLLLGVFMFLGVSNASMILVSFIAGVDPEVDVYRRAWTVGLVVFFIWIINMAVYTFMAKLLPVHPFLRDSLLFFKKRVNAWLIMYFTLWGYCFAYLTMAEYGLAAMCAIASQIVWGKVFFPFDFYKAHVEEYEGHLKRKKFKEPLDNDREDR